MKNLVKTLLVLISIPILSACSDTVDVKGIQELADKVVTAQVESCYDGDTCKAIVNGKKE